ncbi:MAG: hypothetical protein IKU14_01880 [Rhodocyclaceae bacterium]|nr:hypothetical protein [Rhodocyclaceae bacterium]
MRLTLGLQMVRDDYEGGRERLRPRRELVDRLGKCRGRRAPMSGNAARCLRCASLATTSPALPNSPELEWRLTRMPSLAVSVRQLREVIAQRQSFAREAAFAGRGVQDRVHVVG